MNQRARKQDLKVGPHIISIITPSDGKMRKFEDTRQRCFPKLRDTKVTDALRLLRACRGRTVVVKECMNGKEGEAFATNNALAIQFTMRMPGADVPF